MRLGHVRATPRNGNARQGDRALRFVAGAGELFGDHEATIFDGDFLMTREFFFLAIQQGDRAARLTEAFLGPVGFYGQALRPGLLANEKNSVVCVSIGQGQRVGCAGQDRYCPGRRQQSLKGPHHLRCPRRPTYFFTAFGLAGAAEKEGFAAGFAAVGFIEAELFEVEECLIGFIVGFSKARRISAAHENDTKYLRLDKRIFLTDHIDISDS